MPLVRSDSGRSEDSQENSPGKEGDDDEDRDDGYGAEFAAGYLDSGYDTDPIERYMHVTRWQKRLRSVQSRLRQARQEVAAGIGRGHSAEGGKPGEMRERRIGAVARKLREGPKKVQQKVVGTMRERRHVLQQQYQRQMQELRGRLDKGLSRVRSSRARQLRHMICFVYSMVDVVVTSFWLGASPATFHWYYSIKCGGLILVRAVWYRVHGNHYFLFDLCYFSNLVLLVYIWILPSSEELFRAAYGLSGVLLISVPVFRNSFVPHSLDRITSVQVHLGPSLQLWALRWFSHGRPVWWSEACPVDALLAATPALSELRTQAGVWLPCSFRIPAEMSIPPTVVLYVVWATGYIFNQFIWNRKVIDQRGYTTLYKYMAYDLDILKTLPKRLQGPCASRIVFVAGHFALFCLGLPCVYFPFWLHSLALCFSTLWAFQNGAKFYIQYFWRVYETQIMAFERQMAEASSVPDAASSQSVQEAEVDQPPPTPGSQAPSCASLDSPEADSKVRVFERGDKATEDTTAPTDADDEDPDVDPDSLR